MHSYFVLGEALQVKDNFHNQFSHTKTFKMTASFLLECIIGAALKGIPCSLISFDCCAGGYVVVNKVGVDLNYGIKPG